MAAQATTLYGQVTESRSSQGIVGINFEITPHQNPLIVEVYPGTPAARQGLQPLDEVLAINGKSATGLSREQVDTAIPDTPGTSVNLYIRRNQQVFPVRLVVESIDTVKSRQVRNLYDNLLQP